MSTEQKADEKLDLKGINFLASLKTFCDVSGAVGVSMVNQHPGSIYALARKINQNPAFVTSLGRVADLLTELYNIAISEEELSKVLADEKT